MSLLWVAKRLCILVVQFITRSDMLAGERVFSLRNVQTGSGSYTAWHVMKRWGREADLLPPSSGEVNAWSHTSTLPCTGKTLPFRNSDMKLNTLFKEYKIQSFLVLLVLCMKCLIWSWCLYVHVVADYLMFGRRYVAYALTCWWNVIVGLIGPLLSAELRSNVNIPLNTLITLKAVGLYYNKIHIALRSVIFILNFLYSQQTELSCVSKHVRRHNLRPFSIFAV